MRQIRRFFRKGLLYLAISLPAWGCQAPNGEPISLDYAHDADITELSEVYEGFDAGEEVSCLEQVIYLDSDNDGFGSSNDSITICRDESLPESYVLSPGDCDDNNLEIWSTASAFVDNDDDSFTVGDELEICIGNEWPTFFKAVRSNLDDCNDLDGSLWQWVEAYQDRDRDSYTLGISELVCAGERLPRGFQDYRSSREDCDDENVTVWQEISGFVDNDFDGYGAGSSTPFCIGDNLFPGQSYSNTDCDDDDIAVWESLTGFTDNDTDGFTVGAVVELCTNGTLPATFQDYRSDYEDCDDENVTVWQEISGFVDNDFDGYGAGSSTPFCIGDNLFPGQSYSNTDCDDDDSAVWERWDAFTDFDLDNFGYGELLELCVGVIPESGYASNNLDCDDTKDFIHPDADEVCDGHDNDCNETTPDGSDEVIPLNSLQDGVCLSSLQSCIEGSWQDDFSEVSFYEKDIELSCDGLDNNCDDLTDEGFDRDGDGITYCGGDINDWCGRTTNFENIELIFETDNSQYDPEQDIVLSGSATSTIASIVASWVDLYDDLDTDEDGCLMNDLDLVGFDHLIGLVPAGEYRLIGWAKDNNEEYNFQSRNIIVQPHAEFDEVQAEAESIFTPEEVLRTLNPQNFMDYAIPILDEEERVVFETISGIIADSDEESITDVFFLGSSVVYKIDTSTELFRGFNDNYFGRINLSSEVAAQLENILLREFSEVEGVELISYLAPVDTTINYDLSAELFGCGRANFDLLFSYQIGSQQILLYIEYQTPEDRLTNPELEVVDCFNEMFAGSYFPMSAFVLNQSPDYDISMAIDQLLTYHLENND